MKANRIRICGRNTMTEPTPASTPSASRDRTQLSGSAPVTTCCAQAIAASIHPIGASAQEKTAWNIRNRMAANNIGPTTGLRTIESMDWLQRRAVPTPVVTASAMARASRCRMRISAGGIGEGTDASANSGCNAAASESRPRRRTATVGMTGKPSRAERAGTSMVSPSRSARSIILSATTIGRPSRFSSRMKRR